ncbi:probable protein phosphatase 2C 66 [Elaeis guineensis]|uniref:protein-serine/threonine phosphatase n=1 Tax=Elaeis guineensis var. tenera TaxID=51953 RepID=A0A6I9RLD0_ELAGV|nr:probable protein phosphatase 2C 66 [Elaeis guineensis]
MGSCLSTRSPARSTPADGMLTADRTASFSLSRSRINFKSWKERKRQRRKERKRQRKEKERKRQRKEKEKTGTGVVGSVGVFDRRPAGPGNGELAEDELYDVPGRMFLNGTSEMACLYTQQGKKGTNQDAMIVWENFTSRSDTIFCGVFDGHGPFGHMVAKKVRDCLPLKLCTEWRANVNGHNSPQQNGNLSRSMNSEESTFSGIDDEWGESIDENEKPPEIYIPLKQSFLKAFKLMDKELKLHSTIDCFCSGTTAVTVVKQGQDLIIGNVGDSRAILGTRDEDDNLVAVQLTVDLKPNLPREAARIQQCKGRVFALLDEPEVARIWLPNNDSPGLAMARAFGDFCLKDYGLISVPDISYRHLTSKDEFIVLATDGVWDVLSNKEAVDIVASAPTRASAARALVDCAVRAWRLKFPTSKIDDCAVVCLFLEPPSPSDPSRGSDFENMPTEQAETRVLGSVDEGKEKRHGPVPVGAHTFVSTLEHPCAFRNADEIVPISEEPKVEKVPEICQATRSLADCISTTEEEWSALEGITRVNSLLRLPRFLSGDKRTTIWRKWL